MAKNNELVSIKQTDEYQGLVNECQEIICVGVQNFRMEKILMYGRLGERIFNDSLYKKYGGSNSLLLEMMAKDIDISRSELYRAVQFYEKFNIVSPDSENFKMFKEGLNISWNKIKVRYLPAKISEKCQHAFKEIVCWQCKKCKKIFDYKPNEK